MLLPHTWLCIRTMGLCRGPEKASIGEDFSTGVTADSKLPKRLVEEIMPLLDRCEVTFVAPLLHSPLNADQADAHVDLC